MRKTLAKVITLGMVAMMAVSFTGCGNSSKKESTTEATTEKETEATTEKATEATEATEAEENTKMSEDFEKLINDIMNEEVSVGAEELQDFVKNYGEDCNEQTLEAAAQEIFASMLKDNENEDFSAPFADKMEAVENQCLEDNKDLETDVAYNQVVNAINNQVSEMQKNLEK